MSITCSVAKDYRIGGSCTVGLEMLQSMVVVSHGRAHTEVPFGRVWLARPYAGTGRPVSRALGPGDQATATARSDERPRSSSRRRKTRPRGLLFLLLFRQCVRLTVSFSFSFSSLVVHPSKNSISKDSSSLEVSNNLSLASCPALESGKRQFHCKQTACGPYTFYLVAREY